MQKPRTAKVRLVTKELLEVEATSDRERTEGSFANTTIGRKALAGKTDVTADIKPEFDLVNPR